MDKIKIGIKNLFSGSDGEVSLRRIIATILVIMGIVLLFIADKPADTSWVALIYSLRGLGCVIVALFLFGYITMQNIKELKKK